MHGIRNFRCHTVELQRRPAGNEVNYFEIFPANAAPPAGADGFHSGFLGGETRCIALVPVGFPLHIGDLSGSINSIQEAVPITLDRCTDAVHFRQVDAGSDNHNSAPVVVMVSRPCFTPFVLSKASAIFFTMLALPLTTSTSRQLSWSRWTCMVDST